MRRTSNRACSRQAYVHCNSCLRILQPTLAYITRCLDWDDDCCGSAEPAISGFSFSLMAVSWTVEHATLSPCTHLAVWWWRRRSWLVPVKSILPLIVYTNSRLFHVRRNYVSISNLCTNILHVLDKQIVNLLVPVQLKSNRLNKDSDFELQFFCERLSMGPNFATIKPCRPILN